MVNYRDWETEDMSAFKDVLDQHFGTKEKALRFVAENFLLGLAWCWWYYIFNCDYIRIFYKVIILV